MIQKIMGTCSNKLPIKQATRKILDFGQSVVCFSFFHFGREGVFSLFSLIASPILPNIFIAHCSVYAENDPNKG
jgi:hypothetical protein